MGCIERDIRACNYHGSVSVYWLISVGYIITVFNSDQTNGNIMPQAVINMRVAQYIDRGKSHTECDLNVQYTAYTSTADRCRIRRLGFVSSLK